MADTAKRKSKKDLLFNAAMSIIGERGYGGTSVDEIAARAGVAKGVVYYYFDSKAALAEQLIKTGLDGLAVRLDRVITDEMSASEAIVALAHEQMRQVEKRRDFVKFLLSEMWREDREWQQTLDSCIEKIVDIFAREIKRGIVDGEFEPLDDEEMAFIAQTIWATFLSGALNWTVIHPEDDPARIADRLAQYALAGLRS
ncbi:MAG: TetR/AcrR family transcriptional regulator [Coriobacteriia bacterium]|nr:TetR/AcrR family transcriptional regulator [Coriobacteriia bacterium]